MDWHGLRFRLCWASLHKDLFLPGSARGLQTSDSMSFSDSQPARPSVDHSILCNTHNAALFSPCHSARPSGLLGKRPCQLGAAFAGFQEDARTVCGRRWGTSSLAAPSN